MLGVVLMQCTVPTVAVAQPATFHQCNDCDEERQQDLAVSLGTGYRYIFDLTRKSLGFYRVSGLVAGKATATRLRIDPVMRSAFDSMVAAERAHPGLFNQRSQVRVPIDVAGTFGAESPPRNFDPVGVALGYPGPGAGACCAMGEYTSFMDQVRDAASEKPAALGAAFAAHTGVLNQLAQAGIARYQIAWAPKGAIFEVSLCTSTPECSVVEVDSQGGVEFIGSFDAAGNQFPRMNNVPGDSIAWSFADHQSAQGFTAGLRRRGVNISARIDDHDAVVVCSYVGGTMAGCALQPN